jgi:hypothetical protein
MTRLLSSNLGGRLSVRTKDSCSNLQRKKRGKEVRVFVFVLKKKKKKFGRFLGLVKVSASVLCWLSPLLSCLLFLEEEIKLGS